MTRQSKIGLMVLGVIAVIAIVAVFLIAYAAARRRELASSVSNATANAVFKFNSPQVRSTVSLDGEITTVTLSLSNAGDDPIMNLLLDGLVFDGQEPIDGPAMPIRIAALAPGESRTIPLRYRGIVWLDDTVSVDRIDMGWAVKSDVWYSLEWGGQSGRQVNALGGSARVTSTNSGSSKNHLWLALDEDTARVLKERRDGPPKHFVPTRPRSPDRKAGDGD